MTERVRLFLAGRVGQPAYRNLLLSFADRKDFEREILFQRLKEIAPQQGLKLIVFDSLRSLSASVDQGPAESSLWQTTSECSKRHVAWQLWSSTTIPKCPHRSRTVEGRFRCVRAVEGSALRTIRYTWNAS